MTKKTPTGKAWIRQIFQAQIVKKEGMIRRQKESVEKFASFEDLVAEVKNKNWHLIETGDQYIVLCNSGSITIHV